MLSVLKAAIDSHKVGWGAGKGFQKKEKIIKLKIGNERMSHDLLSGVAHDLGPWYEGHYRRVWNNVPRRHV